MQSSALTAGTNPFFLFGCVTKVLDSESEGCRFDSGLSHVLKPVAVPGQEPVIILLVTMVIMICEV